MNWSKQGAALLSVGSNIILTLGKVAVGFATGSVSILSEAIHSGIDLLASCIALFSVHFSDQPADQDHPYGHGKIENVSGVIEGLLIFIAAAWIARESVDKLRHGSELESLGLGVLVMGFSAVLNTLVSGLLYRVAHRTHSVALEADAAHLRTDVYTSAGVFAAIGAIFAAHAIWDLDLEFLDPIIALGVAAFILGVAWRITRKSFVPLLDARAVAEEKQIQEILAQYRGRVSHFHQMRTRRSGSTLHVDLHMGLPGESQLAEAHALSHELKAKIQEALPQAEVLIHVEPPVGRGTVRLDQECECPGQMLLAENGFEVKRLEIAPHQQVACHQHAKGSIRWLVVKGEALVTCGRSEKRLGPGQEIEIAAGQDCALANPGPERLLLVEIRNKLPYPQSA